MENIYQLAILALGFLAVTDLVVGVSNDAVNFLNSAIGSKAISLRTILIVASIGITIGAIFSSGLMEVARKGVFNPGSFMFNEIMIIFMAVMITDVLLLDFFNTLGLPTSTTVSIVFELLGAAVVMALIKIAHKNDSYSTIVEYIEMDKALLIIGGIFLSVGIAFSIGAIVQWTSRMLLSFNFQKKATWVGAIFGGVSISSITYFILMKGLKGTSFSKETYRIIGDMSITEYLESNVFIIVAISLVLWTLVSYFLIHVLKTNIYKIIIILGTFALALAFAGNDLVNFIGVPIAAWQSYEAWSISGVDATEFSMSVLSKKVSTPTLFLLLSGVIMILTLWFSKKARRVTETEINLSRLGESNERFKPNWLSRFIVRFFISINKFLIFIIPASWTTKMEKQFTLPVVNISKHKSYDLPAFDTVRASVNLLVASILISIATSMKLPLSTTYVTFMVAMGTSLADRAWGVESAVYRVAGVLNVIGGWFITALVAFTAAGIIAYLMTINFSVVVVILLMVVIFLLVRSYLLHSAKSKKSKEEDSLSFSESSSLQGVIEESAKNVAKVMTRSNKIYRNVIEGLSKYDLSILTKNKKQVRKISQEVEELKDNIFHFILNLEEHAVTASSFYMKFIGYLQDMTQSLELITKISHKHLNNNHKKLKDKQLKELADIQSGLEDLFKESILIFDEKNYDKLNLLLAKKEQTLEVTEAQIQKEVGRIRSEESSPKNSILYFSLLLETKDLLISFFHLLEEYFQSHNHTIKSTSNDE